MQFHWINCLKIIFYSSTLAQDYDKFWVGVTSTPIKLTTESQVLTNSISTTRQPLKPAISYNGRKNTENR